MRGNRRRLPGRARTTATAMATAAGLALALTATGCWAAPGQGPARRSHNSGERVVTLASAPTLERLWEADTDRHVGDPVLSTGAVHVYSSQRLYGFDPRTGERLWVHVENPDGLLDTTQPFTEGNRVLGSFTAGNRYHISRWFDGRTGALEDPDTTSETGVVEALDSRYVLTTHGFFSLDAPAVFWWFSVLDRSDPSRSWSGRTGLDALPLTLGRTLAFEAGTGVLDTTADGALGQGVRAFALAGTSHDCGPAAAPYFACPAWSNDLAGLGTPVTSPVLGPGDEALYVGTDAGRLVALDAATGAVLWSADLGAVPSDEPALADGSLYVPLRDGRLVVLPVSGCPATGCTPAWSATLGGAGGQPAVAGTGEDAVVVVGTAAGTVEALPAAGCGATTCAPVWEDDAGSPVTGDPAISGGRIYVGTEDGRLVAYAPSTTAREPS